MISNILFLLPFIASCNGLWKSTRYNMDGQGSCKEEQASYAYVFNEDEYADKYIFNATILEQFQLWYSSLMHDVKNPEIVILDLYNCINQYSRLPLVGPIGQLAAHKTLEAWRKGKQIVGKEIEIFSKDPYSFTLVRASLRKIPENPGAYKKNCLNMILELVDDLFQDKPEKYERLAKRLTELETYLKKEIKQKNPYYSEEMAYLKKLFMEHFNTIQEDVFYSNVYADHTAYLQYIHVLLPLVVCSGSEAIANGFSNFLEKEGRRIDFKKNP